jgi:hypothetical protein
MWYVYRTIKATHTRGLDSLEAYKESCVAQLLRELLRHSSEFTYFLTEFSWCHADKVEFVWPTQKTWNVTDLTIAGYKIVGGPMQYSGSYPFVFIHILQSIKNITDEAYSIQHDCLMVGAMPFARMQQLVRTMITFANSISPELYCKTLRSEPLMIFPVNPAPKHVLLEIAKEMEGVDDVDTNDKQALGESVKRMFARVDTLSAKVEKDSQQRRQRDAFNKTLMTDEDEEDDDDSFKPKSPSYGVDDDDTFVPMSPPYSPMAACKSAVTTKKVVSEEAPRSSMAARRNSVKASVAQWIEGAEAAAAAEASPEPEPRVLRAAPAAKPEAKKRAASGKKRAVFSKTKRSKLSKQ